MDCTKCNHDMEVHNRVEGYLICTACLEACHSPPPVKDLPPSLLTEDDLRRLRVAGVRVTQAWQRAARQPSEPLPRMDKPETPEEVVVRGYGICFESDPTINYCYYYLQTPRSRGSVGHEIVRNLTPSELLDVTRRAELLADAWEDRALAHEEAIRKAYEDALAREGDALRELRKRK